MDDNDQNAQGPQSPVGGDNASEGAPEQAISPAAGIQKRIDELTARYRESERHREQQAAQISELTNNLIRVATQSQQPRAPEIEVDPEEAKRIQAVTAPLRGELEQVKQKYQMELDKLHFDNLAQKYPPQVVEKANELMSVWRSEGKNGWLPKDALIHASGLLGVPQLRSGAELEQFNSGPAPLTQHGAPRSAAVSQSQAEPDPDTTPPEKLVEFYEKRLGDKIF